MPTKRVKHYLEKRESQSGVYRKRCQVSAVAAPTLAALQLGDLGPNS